MKTKKAPYNNILFFDSRPEIFRLQSEARVAQLLLHLTPEQYNAQPHYAVLTNPLATNAQKYYTALIQNEAIRFLNNLHNNIAEALNKDEKTYLITQTLQKLLPRSMRETAKRLKALDNKPDEYFIFLQIKHHLIAITLEIQTSYSPFITTEHQTTQQLYRLYFKHDEPQPPSIISAPKINLPVTPVQPPQTNDFQPILADLNPMQTRLSFDNIASPQHFAQVETRLFEYGIISHDYQFIKSKKQSNHTLLAAVCQILIQANYFRRNIIGSHNRATDIDIRKYLDQRYSTNTEQQFRKLTTEQISRAKIKLPWLDNISPLS